MFYLGIPVFLENEDEPKFICSFVSNNKNYFNKIYNLFYLYKTNLNKEDINIFMYFGFYQKYICGIIIECYINNNEKLNDDFFNDDFMYEDIYYDANLDNFNYIEDYVYCNNNKTKIYINDFDIKHINNYIKI